MPVSYASLQLMLPPQTEGANERIYLALCAHMETQGFIPCAKESAERTVAFVRSEHGWALFDDQADRLDIHALDGLGKALSRRLRVRAVGVICDGGHHSLRLYVDGFVRDSYCPSEQPRRRAGRPHRWRAQLACGHTLRELADAFSRGARGEEVFPQLQELLGLDRTTGFGFASLEEAPGHMLYAYFCAGNRIRQRILERPWRTEAKTAKAPVAPCRAEKEP